MKDFQLSRARDFDLESGHTAYCRAPTSTYMPNFIEIEEPFLWIDRRRVIWDPLY